MAILIQRPLNLTSSGRSVGVLFIHQVQVKKDDKTKLDTPLRYCQFLTSFGVQKQTFNFKSQVVL